MRNGIANLLLISLICISFYAGAQALATSADVRKYADGIMANVGAGNHELALKQVKSHLQLPPAEADALTTQLNSQLPGVLERYGPARGFELIRQEAAGESLIRLTYLAKYEKGAMRWRFVFYKGDKGWTISDFKVDTNRNGVFPGEG